MSARSVCSGHAALAVELRARHLGAVEAARALDPDALGTGAHRGLHRLAHGATELHAAAELLGDTLGDQLRVDLGVLHLEDVQLDLLAGELLEVAADAVGLGATAADHDARTRGVDVHPHAVTGALDLDLGDAGPLHALGQQPADGDVLADVATCRACRRTSGDLWSVEMPRRKPFGLIFWPIRPSPSSGSSCGAGDDRPAARRG